LAPKPGYPKNQQYLYKSLLFRIHLRLPSPNATFMI
jgi:hypothetical protein